MYALLLITNLLLALIPKEVIQLGKMCREFDGASEKSIDIIETPGANTRPPPGLSVFFNDILYSYHSGN
jgi:hypothetical protein